MSTSYFDYLSLHRGAKVAIFFVAAFLVSSTTTIAHAQIETMENGGIVDKNTEKDNEKSDDDETDLDKSKYTPSSLSAAAVDANTVQLSWKDNAKDEDAYEIYRQASGGNWQRVASPSGNTESYTDRTARADTSYTYRVRAINAFSETEYSSTASVTTKALPAEVLLSNDIVIKEIADAVAKSEEKNSELISNLEQELRKANDELRVSSETLEQTQACTIDSMPEDQIAKEIAERCESFPGSATLESAADKTGSLLSQLFHSTLARVIMSILFLAAILNNVWWHINHKSVRKELHHHKTQHKKYKALHNPGE